jgi:NTE family protein
LFNFLNNFTAYLFSWGEIVQRWKNLCAEGGGIKGIGLAGSACYMDDLGIWQDIENFCGTSAGAIFALMASLGYTPQEISDEMFSVDFNRFVDNEGYWRQCRNLIGKYGIHSGEMFESWLQEIIERKLGSKTADFSQLRQVSKKNLFVITSNLSTKYSQVFSSYETPTVPLWKAVRASMAIPFYFTAVKHQFLVETDKGKEYKECIFSDGGVFQNFPIQYFDDPKFCEADQNGEYHNQETIGFKLDSKDKIDILVNHGLGFYGKIKNIVHFTEKLINSLMNIQDNYFRDSDDWKRTIFIDTLGVNTTDFNLSLAQKKALFDSGYAGAIKFFARKGIMK